SDSSRRPASVDPGGSAAKPRTVTGALVRPAVMLPASDRSRSPADSESTAESPAKSSAASETVVVTSPRGPVTDVTPGTGTTGVAAVARDGSAGTRLWSTSQAAAPAARQIACQYAASRSRAGVGSGGCGPATDPSPVKTTCQPPSP